MPISAPAHCIICRQSLDCSSTEGDVVTVGSGGSAHVHCYSPYVAETRLKILVNVRCWSIGDTLSTTPVLREIRRVYPKATIDVITLFPDFFIHNPHINNVIDRGTVLPSTIANDYILVLDSFDSTKQMHWATHSVEFSSRAALEKSLREESRHLEAYYSTDDMAAAKEIASFGSDTKVILIHPHKTEWATRDWGVTHMPDLVKKLRKAYPDYKIVSIGGKRFSSGANAMDNFVSIEGVQELFGKLSLLQTLALMDMPQVKLIITPDTGALHMAATRKELPIVGIFTLIKSEFRVPVRNGQRGYKFIGVETDACNCTYNAKNLISRFELSACPKRVFLQNTLQSPLSMKDKLNGMENYNGGIWDRENLDQQIETELEKFRPGYLPCFPSVDAVFTACANFLKKPTRKRSKP